MLRNALAVALLLCTVGGASSQDVRCIDGQAGAYPCSNVDLLARLPLNAAPDFRTSSSDVWGWTDPDTGVEYAIVNQFDHTAFVDLSVPTEPVLVGTLPAPAESVARDAKVYADHVFLSTDAGLAPVQVFDLRRLRTVAAPPVEFSADAIYTDGTDPHNMAINEATGFAYFVFTGSGVCDSGFHFVDVRTPTDPTFAGCFDYPGEEFHDAQCVTYDGPDTDHQGSEMCFGATTSDGTLMIVDVTDKAAPVVVAEAPYPDPRYAHQGWLTENRRYFLVNDEIDENVFGFNTRTLVFDVSDLDSPELAFTYTAETTSTDHNLFVHGDYAYQANYTSGLRILSLEEIDDGVLTEIAFFDTHPEDDATGFDGAFGVYPFFESGIVVVSDMARGLFVLRPRLDGSSVVESPPPFQDGLALSASPNPSGGSMRLLLAVEQEQRVSLRVYDALGRLAAGVFEGTIASGRPHRFTFEASGLAAGVYIVRAAGETSAVTQVVTVLR